MLEITPSASAHLIQLRHERKLDDGQVPRFVGRDGRVRLTFAPSAQPGDQSVDGSGIRILVAADVMGRLDGASISARAEGGKRVLVIQQRSDGKANAAKA